MIWEDVLLPRWFEAPDLARAFGDALHLDPQQVMVVDEAADAVGRVTEMTPLLLQRTPVAGEFCLHVAAFPRQADLARIDEWAVLRTICSQLHAACLIPDDGFADSTWLEMQADGTIERVMLDADALDRDEYYIVRRKVLATA